MPAFTLGGAMVAGLAADDGSVSLHCSLGVLELHRDELRGLALEEGRIRFGELDRLPVETIRSIVRESMPRR